MTEQNSSGLAKATVRGTAWLYSTYYLGKLIVFFSTILLARLLTTDDYGVVGYAVTVISFLDIFNGLGINQAQIYHQKKEHVAVTAFWIRIVIGLFLSLVVWFGAPLIGQFFNDPRAIWVSRVLVLIFPISALYGTHETLMVQDLAFNRKFIPDFAQALGRGIISISLAYLGFGPWSLILGQVGSSVIAVFFYWWYVPWRPSLQFSRPVAIELLKFGFPLLGATIASTLVLNTDYLMIGRYLGAEALGIYTLAFRIPELVIQTFCAIVATVIFPIFVKIQADTDSLGRGFLKLTRYISLFTIPVGLGMALLADSFVIAAFTDKWESAIPIMRFISIYALIHSLGYSAGDIYKAQGKPGILTRLSLVRLVILVPALYWAVTVPANLIAVGWVQIGVMIIGSIIYLVVALKILKLPAVKFFDALRPAFIGGTFLALAVLAFLYFVPGDINVWLILLGGTFAGGLTYLAALFLFERSVLFEGIDLFRSLVRGK